MQNAATIDDPDWHRAKAHFPLVHVYKDIEKPSIKEIELPLGPHKC